MQDSDKKLVTVYKATSRDEAMIAVSMLEAEGVASTVVGDGIRDLEGYSILGVANIGGKAMSIQVLEDDVDRATEILQPLLEQTEPIDEETLARMALEAAPSEVDE